MKETTMAEPDIISSLTAAEMAIAERAAGLSIQTLEDPNFPKAPILGALGWVYSKRDNPTLNYNEFMETHTLEQITEVLGLGEDETED